MSHGSWEVVQILTAIIGSNTVLFGLFFGLYWLATRP